ncbi:S1C family serine protease [Candidatus Uhrbacteria bacterium]|nr:S1C family serine protease [Candidatus Uhrbacteria bacterium]
MKHPFLAFLPTLAGIVAGTVMALVATMALVQPQLLAIQGKIDMLGQATSTLYTPPPVQIVPIEPRPLVPAYPPAFLERRISSVLTIVRRGRADAQPLAEERELGSAVAITSDGWLATSWPAVAGLRLNELSVVWSGRVYPVRRAVRDTATDVVYLNIDANGLPAAAFARASDVESGAAVWFESRPGALRADLIIDNSAMLTREALSSERAGRRFLVQGVAGKHSGAAVWDGGGKLVGIVDEIDGNGASVIPAEGIGTALGQLIGAGVITRPLLGIRSIDLADIALDTTSSTLPQIGSWVRGVPTATPAYRNLVENDVIERVERDILDGSADLGERLLEYRPGVTITLYGRRNGQSFQARVTLGSHNTAESIK